MNQPLDASSRSILVEGVTDRQVVSRLMRRSCTGFDDREICILNRRGKDKLLADLPNQLQAPKVTSDLNRAAVGVILDADDSVDQIWEEVRAKLKSAGAKLPKVPDPDGTIIKRCGSIPRIGVWIMPDNHSTGELEHFLAAMIPEEDVDWSAARQYVRNSERKFGKKGMRAKVHAWIATRESPSRFDEAIMNGDLRTDGELCQTFITWLNRLFTDDPLAAPPNPAA